MPIPNRLPVSDTAVANIASQDDRKARMEDAKELIIAFDPLESDQLKKLRAAISGEYTVIRSRGVTEVHPDFGPKQFIDLFNYAEKNGKGSQVIDVLLEVVTKNTTLEERVRGLNTTIAAYVVKEQANPQDTSASVPALQKYLQAELLTIARVRPAHRDVTADDADEIAAIRNSSKTVESALTKDQIQECVLVHKLQNALKEYQAGANRMPFAGIFGKQSTSSNILERKLDKILNSKELSTTEKYNAAIDALNESGVSGKMVAGKSSAFIDCLRDAGITATPSKHEAPSVVPTLHQ